MLDLNEMQEGVLNLTFKIADDAGLLLLDAKDLRAMLQHVGEHAAEFTTEYGNVSAASIGAIQRGLLAIEAQGADAVLRRADARTSPISFRPLADRGVVNIVAADRLLELAEGLREPFCCGCSRSCSSGCRRSAIRTKPRIVFFFDEAHLLFADAPKALLDKIEQVVRLDPLERRRRLFRYAESARHPGCRARASSVIACSMRCARSRRAIRKP